MKKFNEFSDRDLYAMCKKWGAEALAARRKFAGLLPEVYRRDLESRGFLRKTWLEKRGYTCIYEFAARLAGMSRKQVDLVMRLDQRFEAIPVLRSALVEGEISANKLARVASIATAENQTELLRKTEILSSRALEIYVRERKLENGSANGNGGSAGKNENQDGLSKAKNDQKVLHVHHFEAPTETQPDADILAAFSLELKQKIRELKAKGIDINSLFMEFLQKREHEISEKMDKLGQEQLKARQEKCIIGKPSSRHVPAIIKKIVMAKYGNICVAERCGKPAAHLHHERRFATFGSHDPRFLRPLCRAHHELKHAEESQSKKGDDFTHPLNL